MNALELQAIRHIFAMTVEESAAYIARDGDIVAWQQWESGEKEIPENIARICTEMKAKRKLRINAIIEKINNRIGNNTMRFFPDLVSFQAVYSHDNFLDWKIYQSAAVELYAHNLERLC
ncbi:MULTISPECIES: YdiL family protein [unclassified Citrobacter]|uniref:YdiL family protein n=1 Tax=unclassified Citrobacter TaxID=2644389 RepID=UPI00107C2335|nr:MULTISPECIES: YdiL family protein [unclassified Citrobacter]MDA8499464.1 YdiL family protein [Citrobacter sp. Igbk 17]MDA8502652.1 YdiL family protein [Citrobacter sp. Awk 2]MDA8515987.1 YdiL family protein [Citrobacter sp. Igbk 16]MEB2416901.1 YdiL family protein [Citrobacter sp. R-1.5.2]